VKVVYILTQEEMNWFKEILKSINCKKIEFKNWSKEIKKKPFQQIEI
jgi:hypothetical protein